MPTDTHNITSSQESLSSCMYVFDIIKIETKPLNHVCHEETRVVAQWYNYYLDLSLSGGPAVPDITPRLSTF